MPGNFQTFANFSNGADRFSNGTESAPSAPLWLALKCIVVNVFQNLIKRTLNDSKIVIIWSNIGDTTFIHRQVNTYFRIDKITQSTL